MNHGFEHLGRRDNPLAEKSAFCNKCLLNYRQLNKRNFNAHITSCNHYSVTLGAYIIDIVYSGAILNFRNKVDFVHTVPHDRLNIKQILLAGNKRAGYKINIVFDSEENIRTILFADIFLLERLSGKAHALVV